jgi:prophage regulatory protein
MTEPVTIATVGKLLSTAEVCARLGIKRTKFYELRKDGGFPEPARLGYRTLRWREADIDDFIAASTAATSP